MVDANLEKLTKVIDSRVNFLKEKQARSYFSFFELAEYLASEGESATCVLAENEKTLAGIVDVLIDRTIFKSVETKNANMGTLISDNEFLYLIVNNFSEDLIFKKGKVSEERKSILLCQLTEDLSILYDKRMKYNGFNPLKRIKLRQFNKNVDDVCSQFYSEFKENIKNGKIRICDLMHAKKRILNKVTPDKEFAEFCYSELKKSTVQGEIKLTDIMENQSKLAKRLMRDKECVEYFIKGETEEYEMLKLYKKVDKIVKIVSVVAIAGLVGAGAYYYSLIHKCNKQIELNHLTSQLLTLHDCDSSCKNLKLNDYVMCSDKRERCSNIKKSYDDIYEKFEKLKIK